MTTRASKRLNSQHEYNPRGSTPTSPLTAPRAAPAGHNPIATRISQLRDIFQSASASGGRSSLSRRRENSRSGFGKRKGSFGSPASRNSRRLDDPEIDITHSYLGAKTSRSSHKQEHATVQGTSNWERTQGLHARMEPVGLVFKDAKPTNLWAIPLRPTEHNHREPRKYDRKGLPVWDDEAAEPHYPGHPEPSREPAHPSKAANLSTVQESQFVDPEKGGSSTQNAPSSQGGKSTNNGYSSNHKTINTPLSIKMKNVRDMYDYYGIKRPAELSSDFDTQQDAQPVLVQRNCHICGWINGPDVKCWKCLHHFCAACDAMSPPRVSFQQGPSAQDFATANPIKPSKNNTCRDRHSSKRDSSRRDDSFPLQYPHITDPKPKPTPGKPNAEKQQAVQQPSSEFEAVKRPDPMKGQHAKTIKNKPLHSSEYENASTPAGLDRQENFGQRAAFTTPSRFTNVPKSTTQQPHPIYIKDVPQVKRSKRSSKSSHSGDAVVENRPFRKTEAHTLPKSFRTPAATREHGSHRHRRTRKHATGSTSNSSSSGDDSCCESPGCQATHAGHQPYRHSISCSKKKHRFNGETDSGYIASMGHHEDTKTSPFKKTKEPSMGSIHEEDATVGGNKEPLYGQLKVPRKRLAKKGGTECAQCSGYLSDCQCPTCKNRSHVIMNSHDSPSKGKDGKDIPAQQRPKDTPKPPRADFLGTLQERPASNSAAGKASSPVAPIQDSMKSEKKEPTNFINRIRYDKVKGDTLGKPVSPGYEPIPKVPLYSIAHDDEDHTNCKLPVPKSSEQKTGQQSSNAELSDPRTPFDEKGRQPSFCPGIFTIKSPILSPGLPKSGVGSEAANKRQDFKDFSSPGRMDFKQDRAPDTSFRTPKPADDWPLRQFPDDRRELDKSVEYGLKSPSVYHPLPSCSPTTIEYETPRASTAQRSPLASRPNSRSQNFERDTLSLLDQKLKHQQNEIDKIADLFKDHFSETASPSSKIRSAPAFGSVAPKQKQKERIPAKEDVMQRKDPWIFDPFSDISYREPSPSPPSPGLGERHPDDSQGNKDVQTPAHHKDSWERSSSTPSDLNQDTSAITPKIVIREPTIPIDAVSKAAAEKKKSMVRESKVMQLARAFSPMDLGGFVYKSVSVSVSPKTVSPSNSPKMKTPTQMPEYKGKDKEQRQEQKLVLGREGREGDQSPEGECCPGLDTGKEDDDGQGGPRRNEPGEDEFGCDCAIVGVTVLIHFERKEDVVFKAGVSK